MHYLLTCAIVTILAQNPGKPIKLKSYIASNSDKVKLANVSQGPIDPRFGVINLTDAPAPGQKIVLHRKALKQQLENELPGVRFIIPSKIVITRKTRMMFISEIRKNLNGLLSRILPGGSKVTQIHFGIRSLKVPTGSLRFEARSANGSQGRWSGRIEVMSGSLSIASFSVSALYSLYIKVPVSACQIRSNQKILPSCVKLMAVDVAKHRGYFKTIEDLQGTKARRNITPGTPFVRNIVKLPDLVKRGKKVLMIAHIGQIRAMAWGISKSDGPMGSIVKVMNPSSRKIMMATVTGPGRVEVVSRQEMK